MTLKILEDKLYESFLDSEQQHAQQSEKVRNTLSKIEKNIIRNKVFLNEALAHLLNDAQQLHEISSRIYQKLNNHNKLQGFNTRDEAKCKMMLSRILMTLSYELTTINESNISSEDVHGEFIMEVLKNDLNRMYYYMKYEAPLAACFENYA